MKACAALVVMLVVASSVQADELVVKEEHLKIRVQEGVAQTTLRIVLHNPSGQRFEGDLLLEVDSAQKVERFKVKMNGRELSGELLDGEKARQLYEEIVRKQKDPALLEHYGHNVLRLRAFPIEPGATAEAEIELIQPLVVDGGLIRLSGVGTLWKRDLERASAQIEIEDARGIGTVFCPTHETVIDRQGDGNVQVRYERAPARSLTSMVLYYGVDRSAPSVLAHNDGYGAYFMLTIPTPVRDRKILPRDIVFVVDTSGSMLQDDKIVQVKTALKEFLGTLREGDRFNIVSYGTEASAFRDGLGGLDERKSAAAFISGLSARGGTNMEEALQKALAHEFRRNALPVVIFLTDGMPTIGERETAKLVSQARSGGVRIFTFGVGFDVNTQLLDLLATESGGDRTYVHPKEDVSGVLARFARRVGSPVLCNPTIEIEEAVDVHPKKLPDLFEGSPIVVYGRLKPASPFGPCISHRQRRVVLTAEGFRQEFKVELNPYPAVPPHDFVPRLWAIQQVDYLMDQIRLHGTSKEVIEEIVKLSKEHMIVTPYTSFLILEDTPDALSGATQRFGESATNGYTGQTEWLRACNQGTWRSATNNEAQILACGQAMGGDASGRMRQVGAANFVLRSDGWVDSRLSAGVAVREIPYLSEEYFTFLKSNGEMAQNMALGRNVTFQCGSEWIAIR